MIGWSLLFSSIAWSGVNSMLILFEGRTKLNQKALWFAVSVIPFLYFAKVFFVDM